jgi:hypothetical protein
MTIHKKLLDFQKLGITIIKDGKNDFFKKNGKESRYCTLNEVLDKVKSPLNEMGVVIIFEPQAEGLKTTLHDTETTTEVSSFMKYVDCLNAQKLLACNTYYRRGSIVSLLGLEEEEDDGNKAAKATKEKDPALTETEIAILQKSLMNCYTVEELEMYWQTHKDTFRLNKNKIAMVTKRKIQLLAK